MPSTRAETRPASNRSPGGATARNGERTHWFCSGLDGPTWEMWWRSPLPEHAELVAGLWAGDSDASESRHRLIPDGELWLMFNLGPPQRVVSVDSAAPLAVAVYRRAMISGLHDRPVFYESLGRHPRVVTVRLLPRGACALFGGLSLLELANHVFDLEDVLGRTAGVERLGARLVEASGLGSALDLVEEWLVDRLRLGRRMHPLTRSALDALQRSH